MKKIDNGWGEEGYMAAKKRKLEEQFLNNNRAKASKIFSDICVFIDGFTEPSDNEIKELMQLHGGRFCHYYNKKVVTHIIANNLPHSKINKLSNEKVVIPKWIVDSIEAGKLLDWSKYELYGERYQSNQNLMKKFVSKSDNDNGKKIDTGAISLHEYYAKSRLHHLSTWATELSNYLQSLKTVSSDKNEGITFPGRSEFMEYYENRNDKTIINISEPILMHVDMDCFFVSVGIRNKPELHGQPVVVTHSTNGHSSSSSNTGSMSEIASCSYETRKFGIKNGMHLGRAKSLCPDLIPIPYNFDDYLEVAKVLYRTASRFTYDIEVGSCDELYINLFDILKINQESSTQKETAIIDPMIFADYFRFIIKKETKCPVSCGIGSNLLICKLATKQAKPDGKFWLKTTDAIDSIKDMNVRDLPGIGRVLEEKLRNMNIGDCGQLQQISLDKLKANFGYKIGQKLFDMCRGKDCRVIQTDKQRKSISAEINYGIRLNSMDDCENLLRKLSIELSNRMIKSNVTGKFLLLKLMIRHPDASVESVKYLGHGYCNNYSKSIRLPKQTNDASVLSKHVINLFKQFKADVKELRGIGLVMQRLETISVITGNTKIVNYFQPKIIQRNPVKKQDLTNSIKRCNPEETDNVIIIDEDYDDNVDDEDECSIIDDMDCINKVEESSKLIINEFDHNEGQISNLNTNLVVDKIRKKVFKENIPTITENYANTITDRISVNSKTNENAASTSQITMNMANKYNSNFTYQSEDIETMNYLAKLGNTSVDNLKIAIQKWVESESEPDSEDWFLIRNQLASMVSHRVEWVVELMKFFFECIELKYSEEQENKSAWTTCYDDILAVLNSLTFQEFGAELEFE